MPISINTQPDKKSTMKGPQTTAVVSTSNGKQSRQGKQGHATEEKVNQESRWDTPSLDSADTLGARNLEQPIPGKKKNGSQIDGRSEDSDREAFLEYDQEDPLAEFLEDDEDDLLEKNATAAVMSLLSLSHEEKLSGKKLEDSDSESFPKRPVLSPKLAAFLESVSTRMNEPTKNLAQLISAISSPASGKFDRGYMVRRKNACGAIHVLTSQKGIQRVQICWTRGMLEALRSVLLDGRDQDIEVKLPNSKIRKEYKEARKRVVATLMNLSIPQENRVIVFHTPRLIDTLVETIKSANECSKTGAAALAHLAKTKENRLFLGFVPSLIDTVVAIIEPSPVQTDNNDQPNVLGSLPSAHSEIIDEPIDECFNGNKANLTEESRRYDEDGGDHHRGARQNLFALLLHMVKEKDNAYMFARHDRLVQALAKISCFLESDFHEYACKIIANLTRHRGNTKHLLFNHPMVVQALTTASYSQNDESRKHSCYAIQNFAEDKACRHHLAVAKNVLPALCVRVKQAFDHEERLAAIHALKNLSQEPENLILMTNTADCIPTLMHIADASDDNVTETMQFTGCDALANLSQHFMQIAESGKSIDREKRGEAKASEEVFVPFLNNVTWEQWE